MHFKSKTTVLLTLCVIVIGFSCTRLSETKPNTKQDNFQRKTGTYETTPSYTVTWDDNSTAVLYAHTSVANNYEIKLYDELGVYEQSIIGAFEEEATNEYVRLKNLSGSVLYEHVYNEANTEHVNGYPGDCAKLGKRKVGETYSDCYERNWDNFCCDFTGCISQAGAPYLVAISIAIACAFKDGKITEIYDNNNDTVLYD